MDVIIARGFLWRKQELEIVNIDVINEKTVIRWICFKLNPHFIIEHFHLVTCIIQNISYVLYASLYSLLYLTDFFLVIAVFRSHLRASLAFSHWSNCIYPSLHIYRKNGLRSWDYLCSEDVVCLSCRGTMVNLKTERTARLSGSHVSFSFYGKPGSYNMDFLLLQILLWASGNSWYCCKYTIPL